MCHLFLLCWPWLFKYFTWDLCKFTLPARSFNLLSILFATHLIRHLSGDCLTGLFNFFWPFNYIVNSAKRDKFVPKLALWSGFFASWNDRTFLFLVAGHCPGLGERGSLFRLDACVRIAGTVGSVFRLDYPGNHFRCGSELKHAVASENFG